MHPMLNIAVKAARKAGTVINRATLQGDSRQIERKQHNDFVTEVDRAAEATIIDIIKTAYPDHAILAEESGQSWADGETASENVWVIDPLDGTTNFIHGFPQYAVSIALMQRELGGIELLDPEEPLTELSAATRSVFSIADLAFARIN